MSFKTNNINILNITVKYFTSYVMSYCMGDIGTQ